MATTVRPAEGGKVSFTSADGIHSLDARLDLPDGPPRAYALFAHCFTCGKDIRAASGIARGLTRRGIAVLRFDFTGLGASEGEFANTSFSSNIGDLRAAADWLRDQAEAPKLLIGHSLGGTAMLAAAREIPEAVAVATIGAPASPGHVTRLFVADKPEIEARGEAEVQIGGRPFRIRREFLEDIEGQRLTECIRDLRRALLIFHAPQDAIVSIDNASEIFVAAKHPKSFVSLDNADHLVSRRKDADYVAGVIAAWAERYVGDAAEPEPAATDGAPAGSVTVSEGRKGKLDQVVSVGGRHRLIADEPVDMGGLDIGPNPYDFLLIGLGACTTMTMRMYADFKKLPLTRASVTLRHAKVHARDCADCETKNGKIDQIDREIRLEGPLDEAQRQKLLEIADKCPVHRTLHSEVKIATRLLD